MFKRTVQAGGWIVLLALLMIIVPTGYAHAYLDPGSGSLIVQIIIGGILALLVAVKMYWNRIIGFVTGRNVPDELEASQAENKPDSLSGDDDK